MLETVPWHVRVFYHPSPEHTEDIITYLYSIGCDYESLDDIVMMLDAETVNTGCTHTTPELRESVIIIGITTSADQFNDTYDHEKGHLAKQICLSEGIDPYGEECQYIAGEIGRKMFKAAKRFLCECCRDKVLNL